MTRRSTRLALAALTVLGVLGAGGPALALTPANGTYHVLTPTRILDTRTANQAPLARSGTRPLVIPSAVVPSGAAAVVLTVTVTSPTASGYLTVYPAGVSRPQASNLNFPAHATVPNLVLAKIGTNRTIEIYNGSSGGADVLVDVSGYLTGSDSPSGAGAIGALPAPHRVLDSRAGHGPVGAGGTVTVQVTGAGVPAGVSAVVVNLTAVSPSASGYVTGYATGDPRPQVSNLNTSRGRTVANLAVVPVGANGQITLYNSAGATNLLADVAGYVLADDPLNAGALGSLRPTRMLDTRYGVGAPSRPLAAGGTLTLKVGGVAGIPLTRAAAVVLNVTATGGTRAGYLSAYAGGTPPRVSNVNFAAGQTVPDLIVAPVSSTGTVMIHNGSSGTVNVLADVSGYVMSSDAPLPAHTSTSRYVRNITGAASDAATLQQEGCADATGGSALVLLDIGAQSNTNTPASANGVALSARNPGVRLTALSPPVRVTYAQLETAVEGYLDGLHCTTHAAITVGIGTSNDGDWSAYPATTKADDWAGVVNTLRSYASDRNYADVTIAGASDIEAGFGSSAAQAREWLTRFLAATSARFLENGSLDGCPTTYRSTSACGPVAGQTGTWGIADYVALTKGLGSSRISVLPQIYVAGQQVQWSILAKAAGGLTFAGALTENAACGSCSFTPSGGWAALYHAISTLVAAPTIAQVSDLRIDSAGGVVPGGVRNLGPRSVVPALGA